MQGELHGFFNGFLYHIHIDKPLFAEKDGIHESGVGM